MSIVTDAVQTAVNAITGKKTRMVLSDGTDKVLFNCTTEFGRSDSSSISSHPIERGADISDHMKDDPEEINISVILTDNDLSLVDPESFFDLSVDERILQIKTWKDNRTQLALIGRDRHEDLVIQNISETINSDLGDGSVQYDLILRKIKVVDTEIVEGEMIENGITELGTETVA